MVNYDDMISNVSKYLRNDKIVKTNEAIVNERRVDVFKGFLSLIL